MTPCAVYRMRVLSAIGGLALLSLPAFGQQPTFRTDVRTIEVDAVVRDGRGAFVPDLKADDFEVLDAGRPQKVTTFYVIRHGSPAADRTLLPSSTLQPAPARRIFVLLFDDEHLSAGGWQQMRSAAQRFLDGQFHEGDLGAVLAGWKVPGNRLTGSPAELRAALAAARQPSGFAASRARELQQWPRFRSAFEASKVAGAGNLDSTRLSSDQQAFAAVVQRACADDPVACQGQGRDVVEQMVREKALLAVSNERLATRQLIAALRSLADALGSVPGRKTVVLLGEGFAAGDWLAEIRQILDGAARGRITFYAIDAGGLRGPEPDLLLGASPSSIGDDPAGGFAVTEDGPNSLAAGSGGFVVRRTNDFTGALRRIAEDTSDYYVLGYTAAGAADGRFHPLTVKVTRPGVIVRARQGYVARTEAVAAGGPAPSPSTIAAPGAATTPPGIPPPPAVRPGAPIEPAPLPAPKPPADAANAAPSAASARPTPAPSAAGGEPALPGAVRMRPDAGTRVRELADKQRGAAIGSSEAETQARLGWECYQRGDLAGARNALLVATARGEARPWVFYALGQAHYALGSYEEAATAWQEVRAAVPEFEPAYFDLVDAYLQLRDVDRALRVLREAASRWPSDPEVFNARGTLQATRGALDDAIGSFGKAIDVAPGDGLGYFNLARTLELRYLRSRRWEQVKSGWIANDEDRLQAIANFKRYLQLGGPFEQSAGESLARLEAVR